MITVKGNVQKIAVSLVPNLCLNTRRYRQSSLLNNTVLPRLLQREKRGSLDALGQERRAVGCAINKGGLERTCPNRHAQLAKLPIGSRQRFGHLRLLVW